MKLYIFILLAVLSLSAQAQLYVGNGATLFLNNGSTISSNFQQLTVLNTIQGNGTGKIVLNGNAQQTIASNNFAIYGIEVDNTNHVAIADNISITGNLVLQNGKLLLNNQSLTLSGVCTVNNGVIAAGSLSNITIEGNNGGSAGSLLFSNSNTENIIANLTVNRTGAGAAVTLGNNVKVLNNVTVSNGTLHTGTGNLTLVSTATNTARILSGSGSYIVGSITQERFIPAKATRRFSFISSPVAQNLSSAWQQQIHITGAGTGGSACPTLTAHTNGFDATLTNAPGMFTYNASLASGSRWVANATGTTSFNLTPGDGYRLLVRGNRSIGCSLLDGSVSGLTPSAVTLSATGNMSVGVNMGSITKTYDNNLANNWVLVGNPYPCEIDFTALAATNASNIAASYVIYDPQNAPNNAVPANMYSTWNAGTWSNAPTAISNSNGQYIANGQAFFVQAINATNLSLTFNESHKYNGSQNGVFRNQTWNNFLRIALQQNNVNIDNTVIRFTNDRTVLSNTLGIYDATLLSSSNAFLGSVKAGNNMSIQTRQIQQLQTDEVPLAFNVTNSGQYHFIFSEFENSSIEEIFLKDKQSSALHNIKLNNTYPFTVNKEDSLTYSNRFSIVFKNKPALPITNHIKLYPNPATDVVTLELPINNEYNIKVTDVKGSTLQQVTTSGGTQKLNVSKLASGTYIIEIINQNGERNTEKLIKQ